MKHLIWYIALFINVYSSGQEKTGSLKDSLIVSQIEQLVRKSEPYFFTEADSARFYLNRSYELSTEIKRLDFKLQILNKLIYMDGFHYKLNDLSLDIHKMDSILKNDPEFETLEDKQDWNKFLISSKGNYYFKLKDLQRARSYFEKLLALIHSTKDTLSNYDVTTKRNTWLYLASISRGMGKNASAKDYYDLIINDLKNDKNDNEQQVIGVKFRLSKVLMDEKKFEQAKTLQRESLDYLKSKTNHPGISNTIKMNYMLLISNYISQDSTNRALHFLKESKKWYSKSDPFQKELDVLAGDIYTKKKSYTEALAYYNKALEATKRYRNHQKHQDVTTIYTKLGNLYREKGLFKEALTMYQKGLQHLSVDFEDDMLIRNPNPKKVFSKLDLIKVLREKLKTLQMMYLQDRDEKYLNIALQTSHSFIKTLDVVKPEFESKLDKQFLITEMYPAFYKMVEIAYELYDITKDQQYAEDAFYFMEKSKSIHLLEATRDAYATSYSNIPEKIIDKERQYRSSVIYLEKQIFAQKEGETVSDSLFRLKNEYNDFIKKIEHDYPRYYDLKYNDQVAEIQDVLLSIGSDTAVMSFFVSERHLFLITFKRGQTKFYKIPFDTSLKNLCSTYYESISRLNTEELPKIYRIGNTIYNTILETPLSELKSQNILIIPDGIFNYIPFESLSLSQDAPNYLINTHQISYANSCSLLLEQMQETNSAKNRLVAYAPSFSKITDQTASIRSDLGPLAFNTGEAITIADFFNGKAIIGESASLRSFKEDSKNSNILHCATHAATNDEFPDYSYLAFASDHGNSELLYVKDLYAFHLNADLVTLSACQTGIGKLQEGEGMLSLARGFTYAGAKSLVTTLWKINDQTTATLMKSFYRGLSSSAPKDSALRNAKLSYLDNADDEFLRHPYYWAGFMISGDTTPLKTNTSAWWLLCVIPIILFIYLKVRYF